MKRKRYRYEFTTCSSCEHWQDKDDGYGYCPVLKEKTESDESCNDHKDMKD